MLYIFIFEIFLLIFLYYFARSNPVKEPVCLHRSGAMFRFVFPIALFIEENYIKGRFITYERKLSAKLSELYGNKDIRQRAALHIAEKIMSVTAAILALTLLGAFMEEPDMSYAIFAIIVLAIVFCISDRELEAKLKKRNFSIQYDFPDFLNKLVLLINAGMTVSRAWEKIISDRKDMTPLYEELNTTYIEIRNGKPEMSAYEDFARRCRVKEITKFITVIIQNLRKGNGELVSILKLQSSECWQLRKSLARRLGEEASTKLVLPLMIMFVGILIIVILPAIMQLKYL